MPIDEFSVREILPDLSSELHELIIAHLRELGARTNEELKYVEESDLAAVLPALLARQLIAGWKRPVCNDSLSTEPVISESHASLDSSISSKCPCPAAWSYSFQIPWSAFPADLMKCCLNKRVPDPCDRRVMVRVMVDNILSIKENPKKRDLETIAHAVISKYPKSFMDLADGIVIGSGHSSLTNQLLNRVENVRRRKRSIDCLSSSTTAADIKGGMKEAYRYGCINWSPPLDNDTAELEASRQWLLKESKKALRDVVKVKSLMASTYPLQRSMINECGSVTAIRSTWPLLFEECYLFQHYSTLTGIKNPKEFIVSKMEANCSHIYQSLQGLKCGRVAKVIGKIAAICELVGTETPKSYGVLELLCAYFDEEQSLLFTTTTEDLSRNFLLEAPNHPFLVVIGSSICNAVEYMVTVEKMVVFKTKSLYSAVAYLFVCFYVLNMEYPIGLLATYEFIQRYFAGITEEGSKSTKKRKSSVHPKVLKLIRHMQLSAEFQ